MPIQYGKDSKGNFVRWGNSGKKYYYDAESSRSREAARGKALEQARAIKAHERGGRT